MDMTQKEIIELAMLGVIYKLDVRGEEVEELDGKLLALTYLLSKEETKSDNDNKA